MPGMLSDALLDQVRARQEASFDQTATIQRNTPIDDDQGGQQWVWANLASGVPCRVGPPTLSAVERPLAGVTVPQIVVAFTFAWDIDIEAADRLIYPETDGHFYFVISDPDRGYKTATRVLAARIS